MYKVKHVNIWTNFWNVWKQNPQKSQDFQNVDSLIKHQKTTTVQSKNIV